MGGGKHISGQGTNCKVLRPDRFRHVWEIKIISKMELWRGLGKRWDRRNQLGQAAERMFGLWNFILREMGRNQSVSNQQITWLDFPSHNKKLSNCSVTFCVYFPSTFFGCIMMVFYLFGSPLTSPPLPSPLFYLKWLRQNFLSETQILWNDGPLPTIISWALTEFLGPY